MKRTRLKPRSAKAIASDPEHAATRAVVLARDRVCVLAAYLGPERCSSDLTYHHLRKRSHGGPYTVENGVALCAKMNTWVEDFPLEAWKLGLVCRTGESLGACWTRMQIAGLLSYGPDGGPIARPVRQT